MTMRKGPAARDIHPELGTRLAAFTDGEGCFSISGPMAKGNYACAFIIKLRADDVQVLERYRDGCFGIGGITFQARKNAWAPTASWMVNRKQHVGVIRDLFTLYPLWSKKRRDFEIWGDAVDFWLHGVGYRTDWAPMAAYKAELMAVRAYTDDAYEAAA